MNRKPIDSWVELRSGVRLLIAGIIASCLLWIVLQFMDAVFSIAVLMRG